MPRNQRRHLLRSKLIAYKGGRCERCLKTFHPNVLEFHHRNPKDKSFTLTCASLSEGAWERILSEAEKCNLLCRNCHKEVHVFNDFRFLEL